MSLTAQRIAKHYGGEANGNKFSIPGPGHSSADRSMTGEVRPDAPGGLVLHSFAGDDELSFKDEIRKVCGEPKWKPDREAWTPTIAKQVIEPAQTPEAPKATPRRTMKESEFKRLSQWDYKDIDGEIRYRVKRIDQADGGKEFPVYHPYGDEWKPGRNGDAILYRLADIVIAPNDAVIFMAEGERKADLLAAWGFPATSSKNLPKELKSLFEGRTVAILPDNDEPGEKIAKAAVKKLTEAGALPYIVRLPRLESQGDDILDWDGNADELIDLASGPRQEVVEKEVKCLPLIDLAALADSTPPARKWALEGFIPQGEVTLFTGGGGAGKSLLAKQMTACIAAGLPILKTPAMSAKSLYITCEDDADELHRRLAKIHTALDLNMAEMAGRLYVSSLRGRLGNVLTITDAKGRLVPSETFGLIANAIHQTGSQFVVLDNVAHLFGGDENNRSDVTQFCNMLNKLAGDTGSTILLIAHPNKAGDSYSGSTAWLNAVRSQITMGIPTDGEGMVVDPDARFIVANKANYARYGTKIDFRWHDWAYVLEADLPADYQKELQATIQASHENEIFLACLDAATEQKQATSNNPGVNHYGTIFPRMNEAKGLTKPAFERAFQRLLSIKQIELDAKLWKRPNRTWKTGIKRTDPLHQPAAPTAQKEGVSD